ncbi:MAG: hypothetical protein R2939_14705 [Kofleriaceae bacterium]
MTRAAAGVALVALAACRDPAPPAPSTGSAAPVAVVDPGACAAAVAVAATRPAAERFAALAPCRPCGDRTFDPAPGAMAASELLRACGGHCDGATRDRFVASFDERAPTANRPWRQLASDCPTAIGVDATSIRWASAPWHWLAQIARALATAPGAGALELPLPAWGLTGAGYQLPIVGGGELPVATRHLTITPDATYAGPLPRARLTVGAPALALVAGADYPGPVRAPDELAAGLGADDGTPVAVLAPRGLAIARIAEVVRALDDGSAAPTLALGVVSPATGAGWTDVPRTLPVRLRGTPTPGDLVVELVGGGRLGRLVEGGTLTDRCTLPGVGWTPAALATAARAAAGDGRRLALAVIVDHKVDQLAQLAQAFAAAGFDELALTAAVPAAAAPSACAAAPLTPPRRC